MNNIPKVKIGLVAVSRNCFPEDLAVKRRKELAHKYIDKYGADDLFECPVCIVESELHMTRALKAIQKEDCNALCVYLGNFGPEIAETMLADEFDGPVMFCGATEETQDDLIDGRGDAYCGMLNASYSLHLRRVKAYIPKNPIGTAEECADMIYEFLPIARVAIGLKNLKIISFGPRPSNFMACNAPLQPIYDLGVEVEENSELDLLESFNKHEGDSRIADIVADMESELAEANTMPDILPTLAQYELTLTDWIRTHKGSKKYVTLTSKCWPAFQTQFGFVPCYVNSRLTSRGIPVSCEVDIYGALSEYIGTCVTEDVNTILDINNSVPCDMYHESIEGQEFQCGNYSATDVFMAFHCGNICPSYLSSCTMKNQHIMARVLPDEITKGTVEGDLKPGKVTLYRLQGTSDSITRAYVAQGEILPVATKSYGSIGVFAVHEMQRFYRYVLIGKHYPHHAAIAFEHCAKLLYNVFKYIGVEVCEVDYNRPSTLPYNDENPYE